MPKKKIRQGGTLGNKTRKMKWTPFKKSKTESLQSKMQRKNRTNRLRKKK